MARLGDLRVLRNFLLVCEAPSLAVAAVRANLTQPALSKQVAALEADLGVRLLDRHARGIRLTESGEALRDRAGALVRDADRVVAEVGAASTRMSGVVAIGVVSSLRTFLVAPVVAAFLRDQPTVQVRILEGTSRAMREAVVDGRADLAAIATREEALPLVVRPFATEPLLAVGPPDARLRLDQPLDLNDLVGRPLVLAAAPNSIRTILESAVARKRRSIEVRSEVENVDTAVSLVRLGVGWTVFTYAAVARALLEREVSAAPLRGLQLGWAIARARDRRQSLAAVALGAALERAGHELIRAGRWQTAHASRSA